MNIGKYDEIHIENLVCFARHGVYPEETALGQRFEVSVTMYTKTRRAGMSDELEASTNYGEVSHFITEWMREEADRGSRRRTGSGNFAAVSSSRGCDTGSKKAMGAGRSAA